MSEKSCIEQEEVMIRYYKKDGHCYLDMNGDSYDCIGAACIALKFAIAAVSKTRKDATRTFFVYMPWVLEMINKEFGLML